MYLASGHVTIRTTLSIAGGINFAFSVILKKTTADTLPNRMQSKDLKKRSIFIGGGLSFQISCHPLDLVIDTSATSVDVLPKRQPATNKKKNVWDSKFEFLKKMR
jgi:hypothetical protein